MKFCLLQPFLSSINFLPSEFSFFDSAFSTEGRELTLELRTISPDQIRSVASVMPDSLRLHGL